ncbi:BREX system P-loop protein BrxC [Pseudoalteromonas fenneropenaei]|uniref:BREX system P-loop protein BrxC n=1 Tax=Pseudoalteromonas fenneropenaei TaxID=1737459 RepID=A0ABV7CP51_9GAMM
MLNREIFINDPVNSRLANNGVAKVKDDLSSGALDILEYELRTFVCEGKYAQGIDSILDNYLNVLEQNYPKDGSKGKANEQPGVWISGFFGSGKSHLAKMLRALWTNQTLNNGATARSIADLPEGIRTKFETLSQLAQKHGGVHAASGTLGSGADDKIRIALLAIIFKSVGLPEQYHLARFVIWLQSQGVLEQVQAFVEDKAPKKEGIDTWQKELKNLHVSPILADAVFQAIPGIAADLKEMREMLRAQYTIVKDVSNEEMVSAIVDAISRNGELPLTLVVLDEVQQYIGDSIEKAMAVQELTETCSGASALKAKLIFVGTGQSALSGTTNLQRLMGRFPVPVQLEDTDVDSVIRKVILAKKESAKPAIAELVDDNLGEIARHLRGSTIEYKKDDEQWMVPDYPLLPVRRRFWEKVLPALDKTGTGSQLRNQLRVVHEALKTNAHRPLGYVVPADFLYDQIATNLLQNGVIQKDIYETISRKRGGTEDEQLQSRLLALILLISKLPSEMEYGIYATVDTLSDLLLEDLTKDKHELRAKVPKMLAILEDEHLVMSRDTVQGNQFSLQTVESQAWYDEYRRQESDLRGNFQGLEILRAKEIQNYISRQTQQVSVLQGESKVSRQLKTFFADELPAEGQNRVSVLVPELPEKQFYELARRSDPDSATIFVFVPPIYRTELLKAILTFKAAETTLEVRGRPSTEAGREAMQAMETRRAEAERTRKKLLDEIFASIQVCLAGGQQIEGDSLVEQLKEAAELACTRLYHKFKMSDDSRWNKVYDAASKIGDANAVEKLGFSDSVEKHPVCIEIMRFIGVMKVGKEIIDNFEQAPFGWSKDTIEGALFAMLAAGVLKATIGQERPIDAKNLDRKALSQTKFRPEKVTLTTIQLIKVRGLIGALLGEGCATGEEATKFPIALQRLVQLAQQAGGDAPLPKSPNSPILSQLDMLNGNEQLQVVFEQHDNIRSLFESWQAQADKAQQRLKRWKKLDDAMKYCKGLSVMSQLDAEYQAIIANRSLLVDPCPVEPLITKATDALRLAIEAKRTAYDQEHRQGLSDLLDDENWCKLSSEEQDALLSERGLMFNSTVNVSSLEDIFDSLDRLSLQQWSDKTAALPGLFSQVLQAAITKLQPKTRYHRINKPVINSEQELSDWLAYVERELKAQLVHGPVVPN